MAAGDDEDAAGSSGSAKATRHGRQGTGEEARCDREPPESFGWYKRAAKEAAARTRHPDEEGRHHWWGQRWIEALENVLRGDAGTPRAWPNLRARRPHARPRVEGRQGQRQGYRLARNAVQRHDRAHRSSRSAWKKAIDGMAEKAQFSAELLAGQMPKAIDDVFHEAGVSLSRSNARPQGELLVPGLGRPLQARRGDALRARRSARSRSVPALRAARKTKATGPGRAAQGSRGAQNDLEHRPQAQGAASGRHARRSDGEARQAESR